MFGFIKKLTTGYNLLVNVEEDLNVIACLLSGLETVGSKMTQDDIDTVFNCAINIFIGAMYELSIGNIDLNCKVILWDKQGNKNIHTLSHLIDNIPSGVNALVIRYAYIEKLERLMAIYDNARPLPVNDYTRNHARVILTKYGY
jgi:hypothetical protein